MLGVQIPPGLPFEIMIKKYFKPASAFLSEAKVEIKKVSWPSRKEAIGGTVVVIIAVFIVATFLGLVDMSLSKLIKMLIKY